jgi:lipopolysaccharide transport system ATP-binding protein
MADLAIRARAISKCYSVYETQRARLLHAVWPARGAGVHDVWALRDVDLDVQRGQSVAIIGRNGSGKSTLLQILTGTLMPTSGEVAVSGRVSALLELGSGFNPEYTGRDNVMMNGLILGLDRREIARRFDEIAAFAEIGDAMDRPVKTYSSGMLMRLAFAVQVLTDPAILVIDEALSVGDFFFQQKCLGYIRSLVDKGVTLLFVSHDMGTVQNLCEQAVYLRDGRVKFAGEAHLAIRAYLAEGNGAAVESLHGEAQEAGAGELDAVLRDSIWRRDEDAPRDGRLIALALYGEDGRPGTSFRMGETMRVVAAYRPGLGAPTHVSVTIRNKFDQVVTSLGSAQLSFAPPAAESHRVAIFDLEVGLRLEAGNYSVSVSLGNLLGANRGEYVDSSPAAGPISIHWDYEQQLAPFLGMFGPLATLRFRRLSGEKTS